MKIKSLFYYIAIRIVKCLQSCLGLSTLGSRAIVLNSKNQVLLVKHTYQSDWYLPGGGVKKGESARAAVIRELKEEVGLIVAEQEPFLFGIYHHFYMGVNDYPIIYVIKNYSSSSANSREIEEIGWFHYNALPEMVSPGTKRRLNEYFKNFPIAERW